MLILWLTACAPLVSGPAAVPLPAGRSGEVGGSFFGGLTPLAVREQIRDRELERAAGGMLWGRFELANGVGFGARMEVGTPQFGAGGVWVKFGLIREHASALGIQFEAGFLYGDLSIPAAFRLGRRVWVWMRPTARVAAVPAGLLPLGVSWELSDGTAVHVEVTTLTPVLLRDQDVNAAVGVVGALGLAARF